jgi:hypothetical protein
MHVLSILLNVIGLGADSDLNFCHTRRIAGCFQDEFLRD